MSARSVTPTPKPFDALSEYSPIPRKGCVLSKRRAERRRARKTICVRVWSREEQHSDRDAEAFCEVGRVVQGDEGPIDGVAQVIGCHGVTVMVRHQEKEEEKQGEVEGKVEEELKDNDDTWMEFGWSGKR